MRSNTRARAKGLLVALLLAALEIPTAALAQESVKKPCPAPAELRCGPSEMCESWDEKVCPPTRRRPAIVQRRICCKNTKGRVHCQHMPHCPSRSPS